MTRTYDDVKIQDINEYLGLCQNFDIQFVYLKDSQYICCSNLTQQLNPEKKSNIDKFFKLKHIQLLIQQIEQNFKNPYVQKYEGLFNIILKDNNKCYFQVINQEQFKQYNGYYIHEDLYFDFVNWLDPQKCLQYKRLFNNYLKILTLQKETDMEEMIQKQNQQIEELKKQIPSQKDRVSCLIVKFKSSISQQKKQFRQQNPQPQHCPSCKLEQNFYHLDHIKPLSIILKEFLQQQNLKIEDLIDVTDDLRIQWQIYHEKNAQYQYLCPKCNQEKGSKFDVQSAFGMFSDMTKNQLWQYAKDNNIKLTDEYRGNVEKLKEYLFNYEEPEQIYGQFTNMFKTELCQYAKDNNISLSHKLSRDVEKLKEYLFNYKEPEQIYGQFTNMTKDQMYQYAKQKNIPVSKQLRSQNIEKLREYLFNYKETEIENTLEYGKFSLMNQQQLREYFTDNNIILIKPLKNSIQKQREYLFNYKEPEQIYGQFTNMIRKELIDYFRQHNITLHKNIQTNEQMKEYLFNYREPEQIYGQFTNMRLDELRLYAKQNNIPIPRTILLKNDIQKYLFEYRQITKNKLQKEKTQEELLLEAQNKNIKIPYKIKQNTQQLADYILNYKEPEQLYGKFSSMTVRQMIQYGKDNNIIFPKDIRNISLKMKQFLYTMQNN